MFDFSTNYNKPKVGLFRDIDDNNTLKFGFYETKYAVSPGSKEFLKLLSKCSGMNTS